MSEQQRDPRAAYVQSLPEHWPFLRYHEDHIADVVDEHGYNSQQHTAAVLAELREFRTDNGIDDTRPDSDTYKTP